MWTYPSPEELTAYHEARVAQTLREISGRRARASRIHPVRRWVGRRLVRLGVLVAADPTLRPARSL
jgi:hypothetical protein